VSSSFSDFPPTGLADRPSPVEPRYHPLLGNARPAPEALRIMRERGGRWFCFQNHDLSHSQLGRLQFLKCGEGCTYQTPPERMPDTKELLGWRYVLIGEVNLETGEMQDGNVKTDES
jgi:hypothetical protein